MLPVIIQFCFIIFNLTSLSLGIICIIVLISTPAEHYESEQQLRNILIYTVSFVITAKIGVIGSYFMCKLCLLMYAFLMLLFISYNFITWFAFPTQAIIATPMPFILATSTFDILELICAFYLICLIRNDYTSTRVMPSNKSTVEQLY